MIYRTIVLTIAALSSTPVLAGDLPPSVYVAPGGVYIGTAKVYVSPHARRYEQPYAAPSYDPYYAPPPVRRAPAAYYGPTYVAPPYVGREPVYAPPPYNVREPAYVPPYAVDYAPRPPAGVPYGNRCYVDPNYGRVAYCN
jgi:hypothetical protein